MSLLTRVAPACACASTSRALFRSPAVLPAKATSSRHPLQARRVSGSAAATPVYKHEDLLSTTPSTSKLPRPKHRSSARDGKVSFFQRSFAPVPPLSEEQPETLSPPSTSPLVPLSTPIPSALPPPVLLNGFPNPAIRWRTKSFQTSIKDDLQVYQQLAKARLSAFVVLTAMAGYVMCPVDPTATHAAMDAFAQVLASSLPLDVDTASLLASDPKSSTNSLTLSVLLPMTVGTALCASSAAAFNELIEAPYDAQMARTRNRPVPKRVISPLNAATFGTITAVVGTATLYAINPLSGLIGLGTIILYCPFYTIAKRHSVYNTWLGAVLGALPPMIGWAACTASINPLTDAGAYALFLLLFFWQFPHFNALSHTLKSSYASSGYRMLAVLDPAQNARVAMRYAVAMVPLAFAFPALGLTNVWFPWLATIPNGLMAWAGIRFWRSRSDRNAKQLFWASLVHLPVVLGLAMVCKEGLRWPWSPLKVEDGTEEGEAVSN